MKTFLAVVVSIIISACSNTENINSSPLLSIWFTEACEQAPAEMGADEGKWGRGVYEFTQDNKIKSSVQFYYGSTCTVETTTFVPSNSGDFLSYIDSGTVTLQEGIVGNEFTIIFTTATPPANIDGYYYVSNDRLCFSDGFSFNPFSIRVNGSAASTNNINFEKCLAIKQP